MSYLGQEPFAGANSKLDPLGFNSSTQTFVMSIGGQPVSPGQATAVLIVINGQVLNPSVDYTVNDVNLTFVTAYPNGTSFFGLILGRQMTIGVPVDATITNAKLAGVVDSVHGGTGVNTLPSGIIKGAGTSIAAATATDIISAIGSSAVTNATNAGSATVANNLAGSTVGSIPFQSGPNTTSQLAPGTNTNILTLVGGLPAWGTAPTSAPRISYYFIGDTGATFNVPAGVTRIYVTASGGGGGGGGGASTCGYSGSPAACVLRVPITVTPGTAHTVIVGAGAVASNTTGNPGGASSVGSLITIGGGAGGGYNNNGGCAGPTGTQYNTLSGLYSAGLGFIPGTGGYATGSGGVYAGAGGNGFVMIEY